MDNVTKGIIGAVLFLLTFGGAVVSVTRTISSQDVSTRDREKALELRILKLEDEQQFEQRAHDYYHGDDSFLRRRPAVQGASR